MICHVIALNNIEKGIGARGRKREQAKQWNVLICTLEWLRFGFLTLGRETIRSLRMRL